MYFVSLSVPAFQDQICVQFYYMSIFLAPSSLDDLYEYEEIFSFLSDFNYQFTSSPFSYLNRFLNQIKICLSKTIQTIPMYVSQARQHKFANGFIQAFDDELLCLRNMECYRHYVGNQLAILKGRLINSKTIFDITFNSNGTFKKFKVCLNV